MRCAQNSLIRNSQQHLARVLDKRIKDARLKRHIIKNNMDKFEAGKYVYNVGRRRGNERQNGLVLI